MPLRERLLAALTPQRIEGIVDERTAGPKRLAVVVRPDGDVQVEFHVPGRPGSPFEALFTIPTGAEENAAREISDFVMNLVDEKIVLVYDDHLLRGGRGWVPSAEIDRTKDVAFAASWHGSFDRP
jgi:hypothetical protein